jgi:predicted transcriptional regulator
VLECRIGIRLDAARLAALDQHALASGRSRSQLVRYALDELLASEDAAAIDAAIVEGYERHPAPVQDSWANAGTVAAIGAEAW